MADCPRCRHIPRTARQPTPETLGRFIAARKADVRAGVLRVTVGEPSMGPFLDLEEEPPWAGDGFHYDLRCRSCGTRFGFGAETYHGSGGTWDAA